MNNVEVLTKNEMKVVDFIKEHEGSFGRSPTRETLKLGISRLHVDKIIENLSMKDIVFCRKKIVKEISISKDISSANSISDVFSSQELLILEDLELKILDAVFKYQKDTSKSLNPLTHKVLSKLIGKESEDIYYPVSVLITGDWLKLSDKKYEFINIRKHSS